MSKINTNLHKVLEHLTQNTDKIFHHHICVEDGDLIFRTEGAVIDHDFIHPLMSRYPVTVDQRGMDVLYKMPDVGRDILALITETLLNHPDQVNKSDLKPATLVRIKVNALPVGTDAEHAFLVFPPEGRNRDTYAVLLLPGTQMYRNAVGPEPEAA